MLFQMQCGKLTWGQVKQWNLDLILSIQENQIVHITSGLAFVDLEQRVDLIILLIGSWYDPCNAFGQILIISLLHVLADDKDAHSHTHTLSRGWTWLVFMHDFVFSLHIHDLFTIKFILAVFTFFF